LNPQSSQPIKTEIGFLKGRDAIYLDKFDVAIQPATLELEGSFNGKLASKPTNEWIDYSIIFSGVLAFKVIELDLWDFSSASSFDEVINSEWRSKLNGKVSPENKHYLIQTYDYVVEVICERFLLTIKARTKQGAE